MSTRLRLASAIVAVTAEGSIRGDVAPVGVAQAPFSRTFEGALRGAGPR